MTSRCPNGASLQDLSDCALIADLDNDILPTLQRGPNSTPVLVARDLFPQNLQTNLTDCDGTASCKYVGFDFGHNTGQVIQNMKYDIDISQVGGSKGVFTKTTNTLYYKIGLFSASGLSPPSSGGVNFSGSSASSTTRLTFNMYDRNGTDRTNPIMKLTPSSTLRIFKTTNTETYTEYRVVSSVNTSPSLIVNVTYLTSVGSFVTGDSIDISFPGSPPPTMMVAPPGYTFNTDSIIGNVIGSMCANGTIYEDYCREEATHDFIVIGFMFFCVTPNFTPLGWTPGAIFADLGPRYCIQAPNIPNSVPSGDLQACKNMCDNDPTCKGFNFNPTTQTCRPYNFIRSYGYVPETHSFTKQNFPTSTGKLIPSANDSLTYLGNTGNDCDQMEACNSNIAQVFDTYGVTSMSTTDIESCGYCPVKIINKVAGNYLIRDEVGRTVQYTSPSTALAALQYSSTPNPSTVSNTLLGLYKVTPYTGTKSRFIFITGTQNIIMVHAEHHDAGEIDISTGDVIQPGSGYRPFQRDINAVQFSFVLEDGTVPNGIMSIISQFGSDNKIVSIHGDGTTTTVTTAMPHSLKTSSTIYLYGDDLPTAYFIMPTMISSGKIRIVPNSDTTLPSVSFTFPHRYSGSSSAARLFYSKDKSRGIPTWDIIPIDYVTNGYQFKISGANYLKKSTSPAYPYVEGELTLPQFFQISTGTPEKYSQNFADTVFIFEKVQTGSTYTRYECPAVDTRSDCATDVHKGHRFQTGNTCYVRPERTPITLGVIDCVGICEVTCPSGYSSSAGDDLGNIGCLDIIFKSEYCIKSAPPTTFTVVTQYDMIFDMFTSSEIYNYPENMIFQSLTGVKYLLENKRLRKIKNDTMYYYVMKNSGTDSWYLITVPSTEMLDDMPKGDDVTVPQDTGTDTENNLYVANVGTATLNPGSTQNYQNLTQKAWVTQILACPVGSYSNEGIKPCTVCGTGSTSTPERTACVCSNLMYFWNNVTNTCDLKGCTGNKYNLVNGKEPCTECVSGSTVNGTHTACVCPVVANGTNTWQPNTNTCTLVCNPGFTAYGNRCIDNLPNSTAQAALDLEMQRVQFAFTPTFGTPPPSATNAEIQNALTLEMQRVMYDLRNTGPVIDGTITPTVQSSLDLERDRVQGQFTNASPTVDDIKSVVQSQLDITVSGASKYSVPCQPGGGLYSATGFEPCFPCSTCAAAPANGTLQSSSCTPTTDTVCTYACKSGGGFTSSGSGAASTCTCPAGSSYINGSGVCTACATCPADTTTTKYTASGCSGTSDRTCTRSCQPGYYDKDGTCTICSTCTAPANATVTSPSCTANQDAVCKYSCNIGYYGTTSCTACYGGNSTLSAGKTSSYDCFEVANYNCPDNFWNYDLGGYDCAYGATYKNGYYNCPYGGTLYRYSTGGGYVCVTSRTYQCSYTPGATIKIADDSKPLCWTDCGSNQYKDPATGTCKTCASCTGVNSVSSIYPTSPVGCGGSSAGSCDPTSCRNGYLLFDIGRTLYGEVIKKCTCSYGSYIKADGTCVACTTSCPANTPSTVYTFTGGCDGFHIDVTSDRICTRTCQAGYYDNNGTCTACSTPTCTAPTNGTVQTTSCTPTTDAYCTYACKSGFKQITMVSGGLVSGTSGSNSISCICQSGKYIKADGTCATCTACPANTPSTTYTATGCSGTTDRTCTLSCNSGYYKMNGTCAASCDPGYSKRDTVNECIQTIVAPTSVACPARSDRISNGSGCTGSSSGSTAQGTRGYSVKYINGTWTPSTYVARACTYTGVWYTITEVLQPYTCSYSPANYQQQETWPDVITDLSTAVTCPTNGNALYVPEEANNNTIVCRYYYDMVR